MLKVFLVEDEFVVREGIKNNIDWEAHGYEFCGEASDGELAFPMIQKLKPDIVITDIRMPFMDGLVLSRLIKKEMPQIEIVILSGYEEFEYAKEAVKIGVAEYLSKPINGEELLKEMDALALKIEEKKQEREIREKYRKEMEESFRKERKELFSYLVTASKSPAELIELADKMNIDLSALWYNIMLLKTRSINHADEEYSNSLIVVEQELKRLEEQSGLLSFDRNLEGKAILFRADSKEQLEKLQEEYVTKVKEILKDYENIRYFGGIGSPVNRLRELPFSFEQASHAFAHRYLVGESLILSCDELEKRIYLENDDFDISKVDPKQMNRDRIREFLKLGDREETIYFVDEFMRAPGENALDSSLFRQYMIMDVYFCVADFIEGLSFEKTEIPAPDVSAKTVQGKENAVKYVTYIIEKALELRERMVNRKYGDIVDKMMQYVSENYANENLTLNLMASYLNFSPNHLSMIFSQQTGQTFIKYLTDIRMNKAKELLRGSAKRSSEIGIYVGYKDPHYFSYLFKKTQGMTPTQYRENKKE